MQKDLIRYDLLVQDALKGVVRKVLGDAARDGLPGDHHFYVSFRTDLPGVRVSNRLREKYPEEMTIVLQHQFWDLGITEHGFEVGLSFSGVPERLLVPYDAVTGFFDPSVQFGLKFEVKEETPKPETDQDTAETIDADPFGDTAAGALAPAREPLRQGKDRPSQRLADRTAAEPPLPRSPAKGAKGGQDVSQGSGQGSSQESGKESGQGSGKQSGKEAGTPSQKPDKAGRGATSRAEPGKADVAKDDADKSGAEVVSLDSFRKKH